MEDQTIAETQSAITTFEITLLTDDGVQRKKALKKFGPTWKADGFWKFKEVPTHLELQIIQDGRQVREFVPSPCEFASGYNGFKYDSEDDDFTFQIRLTHTAPKVLGLLATFRRKEIENPITVYGQPYAD